MHLAAVTGTNGKTSTVGFARQLSTAAGRPAASLGTLGLQTPWGHLPRPVLPPGPEALRYLADDLEIEGVDMLAFEAHSGALQRGLFDELDVTVGVFTNLTPDHLDVHGDVPAYGRAKQRLFDRVVVAGGTAVLHRDVPEYHGLAGVCARRGVEVVSYGSHPDADLRVASRGTGSRTGACRAGIEVLGRRLDVELRVEAEFMVHNVLAAMGLATATGVSVDDALKGLPGLVAPEGRMERVPSPVGVQVIIDFAHTPAALEAALSASRPGTRGRLLVVFGCGGERDTSKRGPMGGVAGRLADVVVITDDNPRGEDPAAIRAQVRLGCPGATEVPDRRDAIAHALSLARSGDTVLVAGRGHETEQQVAGRRLPLRDHDLVREVVDRAGTGT